MLLLLQLLRRFFALAFFSVRLLGRRLRTRIRWSRWSLTGSGLALLSRLRLRLLSRALLIRYLLSRQVGGGNSQPGLGRVRDVCDIGLITGGRLR